MSSVKAFPLVIIVFMVVIIFTGILQVGDEIITNNNLDNESKELIVNLNSNFNSNFDDLSLSQSNLTANATFEGQDPFVQQFLESKEDTSILGSFVNKIISIPDLLLLGINPSLSEEDLSAYKLIINAFIVILLFVVGFVAIFGDGRIT